MPRSIESQRTPSDESVPTLPQNQTSSYDAEKGEQTQSTDPNSNATHIKDPNLVTWDRDDPMNPYNWSVGQRSWITFQLGMLALGASLGSSIISPAQDALVAEFGISRQASVLVLSLYVLGFGLGPILWAPISELWGRRLSLLPGMFCLGLFSLGAARAQNIQTVFLMRFFGGVFGSAPVSNAAAAMGDLWTQESRGTAITFYAIAVTGGPTLGPLIGSGIVVDERLGWRWTMYILAIWVFVVTGISAFGLPEMYAPVLLAKRARRLRKETGNEDFYHPHESQKLSFKDIITKHFSRPMKMLFTEPMVACIAIYASFVFGLLYLTLEAFPFVYADLRHWAPVPSTLPFLGLFVGVLAAISINLGNQSRYRRISRAANGAPVPEARCPPIVVGGVIFAIGLFWFGWTASPEQGVHWASSVVATGFIGAGFNSIFQQCINFLVDTYGVYAASAVSANTFLRSLLAAAFPLLARPMLSNLGVGPALSLLGGLATLMIPVPLLFMRYGKLLRSKSAFAREIEEKRKAALRDEA